ncbi:MAG: adenylyl-sulfate kinase [Opitutaceae bacterium]|nr:adenylyl-sulfate kinase [Opitutaceae bacterium]
MTDNLFPIDAKILDRATKESLLQQRGQVIWLSGLSGSGKSTLANALERKLHSEKFATTLLDGDNIRTGLNSGLGFSDEDRAENIRRIAEVSKLFVQAGVIVINSFITPQNSLRKLARNILGQDDLIEVFVECSFEECERRDVKGLYAKAKAGGIPDFTGQGSAFEIPENPDLILYTEKVSEADALETLYKFVRSRLNLK